MRKLSEVLLVSVVCISMVPRGASLHVQKSKSASIKISTKNGIIAKNPLLRRNNGNNRWDNPQKAEKGSSLVRSTALKMTGGSSSASSSMSNQISSQNKGRMLLILVAFLYGSLNVAFKMIYAMPDPPMASTLSVARGWLAAATFIPIVMTSPKSPLEPAVAGEKKKPPLWKAALELAFWNFGAQGLLNIGLLFTDASRASFLTQMSVVITPIISMFSGQTVPKIVWAGCAVALSGLVMLSGAVGGAATTGAAAAFAFSTGDVLVLGGALAWSMYLFRIASVGKRYAEIPLQSIKTTLLAMLYSVWFGFSALQLVFTKGATIAALWPGWKNMTAWALLLYSAVGPGAVADVLQQQGQKEVSASEANVILSSEPVFTAICARLILGEITSATENIGGGLIVLGALLASGA